MNTLDTLASLGLRSLVGEPHRARHDSLTSGAQRLALGRRAYVPVRQNLALSALVGSMVVGAVVGALTLPMVVLALEVSEFVVIGNGLRILRFRRSERT